MAVLETIIKVVLALAAVAFVGYPFLRSVKEEEAPQLAPEEEQLLERKGAVEGALREVEFDYRTGKLAEKDYQELMSRYRREQAEVLSMLGEPPAGLESAGTAVSDDVHAARGDGARRAEPPADVCRVCGSELRPGNKFCGSCGAKAPARS